MVDGAAQPYLANHVIKGRAVLPVVLVIEWFMRAARAVLPDMTPTALRAWCGVLGAAAILSALALQCPEP